MTITKTSNIIQSNLQKYQIKTPRLSIVCRIYGDSGIEYWTILAMSYLLFWPIHSWSNSDLVIVLDEESGSDHRLGTLLGNLPPYPIIRFEKKPPPNTLCSSWRNEGYSRQIFSSLYSDNHTDAEFIGITDSDAAFIAPISVDDLFENGKPRIIGYNGCCTPWGATTAIALGIELVAEFTILHGYPFIIKRIHFQKFRDHMTQNLKMKNFEEAFYHICSKYTYMGQADFLITYVWHFHRDDYSWHIMDNNEIHYPEFSRRMTDKKEVLEKNIAKPGVVKHGFGIHYHKIFYILPDYLCVGSNWTAGSCPLLRRQDIEDGVFRNQHVDWLVPTAFYQERAMTPYIHLPYTSEVLPKNWKKTCLERFGIEIKTWPWKTWTTNNITLISQ